MFSCLQILEALDRKSGSAGMPRPISYAVFCLQKKNSACKITSVLFGDLVGFTTLSENRDAEEVRELLTAYFEECRSLFNHYATEQNYTLSLHDALPI